MQRELVERAMTGDHDAFSELVRLSSRRLLVIARLILRDDGRAEDATQEALVAAWRQLKGLRDPDRFEAWLHRLLVNACYREARRTRRRGAIELQVDPLELSEAARGTDLGDDFAGRDQLERGFRRLEIDHRVVLVLHYYMDFSLNEASSVLGIPPGTVKSRLNRAITAMRASLEADARGSLIDEGWPA